MKLVKRFLFLSSDEAITLILTTGHTDCCFSDLDEAFIKISYGSIAMNG